MNLILASSSVFRKQLLSKLRVPFTCISPNIDESRKRRESVTNYVKRLSINKALKVAESHPGCIVIGSDEVADLNNKILGKPLTRSNAVKQLRMISGNKVVFRTGLCVMNSDTKKHFSSVNNYTIYFKHLDNKIINSYLDTDDDFPLDHKEWLDTDGDGIGNNKDKDDDNDGVEDKEDALPLDPKDYLDTDKDGIGNNLSLIHI